MLLFSRADPRVIEAVDVISSLDRRPNLLDLTPEEFESFIQNLFTMLGYETDQYRGTMQHEGAALGILITTSGYGPASEEFANGKPLHLIDGPGLLVICQEHGIPARILGLGTRRLRS